MRQITLDTETTGLSPTTGHRLIEVAALVMVDRKLTGETFHTYLQPDREIDRGAQAVHGISSQFLTDKPRFFEIAPAFLEFIKGSELIIHNAAFDLGFLNHELKLLGKGWKTVETYASVIDTLSMARSRRPGQKNSLDALCKHYGVDNSHRQFHGALLDARLLADVYLAMTGGQVSLAWDAADATAQKAGDARASDPNTAAHHLQKSLQVVRATAEERAAHAARLAEVQKA